MRRRDARGRSGARSILLPHRWRLVILAIVWLKAEIGERGGGEGATPRRGRWKGGEGGEGWFAPQVRRTTNCYADGCHEPCGSAGVSEDRARKGPQEEGRGAGGLRAELQSLEKGARWAEGGESAGREAGGGRGLESDVECHRHCSA